jgi:hypothetical protein
MPVTGAENPIHLKLLQEVSTGNFRDCAAQSSIIHGGGGSMLATT